MNTKPQPPYLDGWLRGASGKGPSDARRTERAYMTGWKAGTAALTIAAEHCDQLNRDRTFDPVAPGQAVALVKALQQGKLKR